VSEGEVQAALREAVEQELVIPTERSFRFAHDRVQEAAYSLIAEDTRAESHLRIGRLLWSGTPPEKLDDTVFEIVSQLNRGANLIMTRAERDEVAQLNLRAAKRAKASTAYSASLAYLAKGRAFLDEAAWAFNYKLIFAIECLTAECELLVGEMGAAEVRLTELAAKARTSHDSSVVTRLRITLYTTLDQSERCVDVFLEYLGRGGTAWRRHPTRQEVLREYERVATLVAKRQIEELVELPLMTNSDVLDALDVFTEVVHPALFYDENLSSLVVCRMVSLSLEHGNCDASCFAYVWFGMFSGPRFDNYSDGFRFGQLGLDLVEKRGLVRYQARTYLTLATLTPWTRHLSEARGLIRLGLEAAHRNGDLTYSAYSWKISITNQLLSGAPLGALHAEAETAVAFATKSRFGLMVTICGTQRGLIRTLCGLTPRFGSFDDEDFDELSTERQLAGNPLMSLAEFFYWTRKLQARYFAGDLAAAVAASEEAQRLAWTATSQVTSAELPFYGALVHAASWHSALPEERQRHLERLRRHHGQLEMWARHCPANFENRAALVAAEIARIEARDVDAGRLYEHAIRSAREHGFVQNEALANELAARYYLGHGLETPGYAHLRNARGCYDRWGARGKVDELHRRYPRLRDQASDSLATIGAAVGQLDVETVVKASQALSSEMDLHRLIEKLVRIAVQHAGAERGLLILVRDAEPWIEAEAASGQGRIDVVVRQAAVTPAVLLDSALHYALRMRECVLLDDASSDDTYSMDEYVRRRHTRSVLCLPIVKQSTTVGALYLENGLTPGAFTSDRVTVLQLLASQAAISLENAGLYSNLQLQAGLLQNLPVSAWTLNADGTPDFVNQVWLDYSGQTRDFVRSHPEAWMTAVHPDDRESASRTFRDGVRSGHGFAMETRSLRSRDGAYRWHLNQAVVLRDGEGKALKFVGTSTDIDDQKRVEEALRQAQSDLTRINRVTTMGELAATLAHELSQPISGAMTNANVCLRKLASANPDLQGIDEAVTRIARDTKRAAEIIERIRSQFRKSPPKQESLDVGDTFQEVINLMHDEAARNNVTVGTELADDLPRIVGDRVQLQQVAMNLLLNGIEAMKDTDGTRKIVLRALPAENDQVFVSVSDTGVGLLPHAMDEIFDPFFTTKPHGTGMGLRISRSIIESHGGRLWATPNEGPGATFAFLIPSKGST
jgi:PAS domain S-box-containing protein